MGKSRKISPLKEAPPEAPGLDAIALHDTKLLGKILLGALIVDLLFVGVYVPLIGPPLWFSWTVENVLYAIALVLLLAAGLSLLFSLYFYFRNRIRAKT